MRATTFYWADRLRNLATAMVVIIHVAASAAQGAADFDSSAWMASNFWNAISRPAVPLFVMLSGFLLFRKDYPLDDFLKRRFTRVVIPAVFWMIVYTIFNHIANHYPRTFTEALKSIADGPVHYHLWFIYLILGLYLLYPIFRPWVRQATDQDFAYVLIICVLATWIYKITHHFFGFSIGIQWELFSNNLIYFIGGYYFGSKVAAGETPPNPNILPWPWKKQTLVWIGVGLIISGTLITAAGAYWMSKAAGQYADLFHDYLMFNVSMSTLGWFLLAQNTFNGAPLLEVESKLAESSFGIYLMHVLVMDWWAECGYWHSGINPAKGTLPLAGMILLTTFLAVLLIRTLPFGKQIT